MPVLVVGADTEMGKAAVDALLSRDGEVRAFVTDPGVALDLKKRGVKVATGDVSDASHVGGAATSVFSAVLVSAAATDDRERSFAATPLAVARAWAEGLSDARVKRIIWVGPSTLAEEAGLSACAPEFAVVEANDVSMAATMVAEFDERAEL
ncbi:MAG: NmrA family NAD(P)-binding protein [Acidimicrobiia bacterium]|nr:NmrA family NAD(P)-binding protein [Acidimicrobiia bacterium]